MSGQWPPDWEDPDDGQLDDGLPDERHSAAGHSELELSEVASFLASVHSPALPASFEARISAAIAAEAAARSANGPGAAAEPVGPLTAAAGAEDAKDTVRSDNPEEFSAAATAGGRSTPAGRGPRRGSRASRSAAAASRPGGSRPGSGRRRLRMPSMQAASWTLVCVLVLSGFGFLVSRGVGSSASSSYEGATSASSSSASAPAAGNEPQPASGVGPQSPDHAFAGQESGPTGFVVHSTGTAYQQSTLASQVRNQLASLNGGSATTPASSASATASFPPASTSASAASSSVTGGTAAPSPALSGCVSRLTGGHAPSLVDEASYDGRPAYIIAVPTDVWVVGRGCTAADTQLITRVALKG
jgi:hypothetical protein